MAALVLFLALSLILPISWVALKVVDQRWYDRNRKTYKVSFPRDLDAERVEAWLGSISGTLVSKTHRLFGIPTIVYEVSGTPAGIEHRLKVPWTHAEVIIPRLRTKIPGIRIEEDNGWPERQNWTAVREFGLTNANRQLTIRNGADVAHDFLSAMQSLQDGEKLTMQLVVSTTSPQRLPVRGEAKTTEFSANSILGGNRLASADEVNDRRDKLVQPNFLAVLRVGAVASTQIRADSLIFRIRSVLNSITGPASAWVRRFGRHQTIAERLAFAKTPVRMPIQLSAPELTALIAWPVGNPFVSGLPTPLSKQLPAPINVPSTGRVIGHSTFPGAERPVAIGYGESLQHLYGLGPTGSGKSVTMQNIVKQDMEHGYGVVVLEPQGSLVEALIDLVPPERLNDVIVFDPSDTANPVGFNILHQGNPHAVADQIAAVFEHIYGDSGVWARQVLFFGLRTLAYDDQSTVLDLASLVAPQNKADEDRRREFINKVKDPELRAFWAGFDSRQPAERKRVAQPVIDRIWQLTARRELRNILGQPQSSFSMDDVVRNNKILLVNLSKLPAESANLMGTLIVDALWRSVQTTRSDKATFLHIDEFQRFINLPFDVGDMLARARGLGLGMHLVHQHMHQLPSELQQAVLSNTKSKYFFQTSADDARMAAREFGELVSHEDFMHLGRYETLARILTPSGMSPPLSIANLAPPASNGRGKDVLNHSRKTYGRPIAEVEAILRARLLEDYGPKIDIDSRPPIDDF